ncbi:MAG TPA: hypothetical protein VHB79_02200 [Polyangiaceae bacterium]|nr:hypothetical protein [Polyangiaceae bacterium]
MTFRSYPRAVVIRGCALGALLSLMSGCKPERAPFVDGARQSAGGAADEPSSTDAGGDGTLENGGPGTPGGNTSSLPRDVFDPEKIYLQGETRLTGDRSFSDFCDHPTKLVTTARQIPMLHVI